MVTLYYGCDLRFFVSFLGLSSLNGLFDLDLVFDVSFFHSVSSSTISSSPCSLWPSPPAASSRFFVFVFLSPVLNVRLPTTGEPTLEISYTVWYPTIRGFCLFFDTSLFFRLSEDAVLHSDRSLSLLSLSSRCLSSSRISACFMNFNYVSISRSRGDQTARKLTFMFSTLLDILLFFSLIFNTLINGCSSR